MNESELPDIGEPNAHALNGGEGESAGESDAPSKGRREKIMIFILMALYAALNRDGTRSGQSLFGTSQPVQTMNKTADENPRAKLSMANE